MKSRMLPTIIVLIILLSPSVYGQPPQENQHFPEGVYFNFKQLVTGKPGLNVAQLRNAHLKNVNPKQWFKGDSLFFESGGNIQVVNVDSIYAFCDDGQLFIQRKTYAHKVTLPGTLSFFSESYPVKSSPAPVSIDLAKDMIPRILDFETGKIREYTVNEMEEILKDRDPDLYQEFISLETQRIKRQLLLRYIEKYNDRHPLLIKG